MEKSKTFDNYPFSYVLISVLHALFIYILGFLLLLSFGLIWSILYILYCVWIELRIWKKSCTGCSYYNKICCFGRSKLAPILFKKGDPKSFIENEIHFKDLIPDFLVSIIPIIIGIIRLITDFNLTILSLLILLIVLAFPGNGFIRGNLACKHCKQREIGCSADKLFRKE